MLKSLTQWGQFPWTKPWIQPLYPPNFLEKNYQFVARVFSTCTFHLQTQGQSQTERVTWKQSVCGTDLSRLDAFPSLSIRNRTQQVRGIPQCRFRQQPRTCSVHTLLQIQPDAQCVHSPILLQTATATHRATKQLQSFVSMDRFSPRRTAPWPLLYTLGMNSESSVWLALLSQ